LTGNFNVVTGPDDYSTSSAGPWVLLNEQFNFLGDLNNQSLLEGKLYLGGLLPAGFRGGAFFSYATGDRVTPTLTISSLLTNYAVVMPRTSDPTLSDTLTFHSFLFSSTSGQRIFLRPRGSYRYQSRASLDLHLERSFPRGRTEVVLVLDGFNVLGDRSVTEVQTAVNVPQPELRADGGRVARRSHESNAETRGGAAVPEQPGRGAVLAHGKVEPSVTVEVRVRRPPLLAVDDQTGALPRHGLESSRSITAQQQTPAR